MQMRLVHANTEYDNMLQDDGSGQRNGGGSGGSKVVVVGKPNIPGSNATNSVVFPLNWTIFADN